MNISSSMFLVIALTFIVSGCATQNEYRKADSKNGSGYREHRLTQDQWLISFRSRGSKTDMNYQYALQRAAERTQIEGYDWFEVVHRETLEHSNEGARLGASFSATASDGQPRRRTHCGLLTCSSEYTERTSTREASLQSARPQALTTRLEIRMGKGVTPDCGSCYSAMNLVQQRRGSV